MGVHNQLFILMNVAIASLLTGIVGFEREKFDKPAGIRTNMIVGGAVALLISLGDAIVMHFQEQGYVDYINTDPTRIIQAIIVGVSFIGAGTVLQIEEKKKIKFLTTAATILFSTAIGIAVALQLYILAVTTTAFIIFINYVIAFIDRKIKQYHRKRKEKDKEE